MDTRKKELMNATDYVLKSICREIEIDEREKTTVPLRFLSRIAVTLDIVHALGKNIR